MCNFIAYARVSKRFSEVKANLCCIKNTMATRKTSRYYCTSLQSQKVHPLNYWKPQKLMLVWNNYSHNQSSPLHPCHFICDSHVISLSAGRSINILSTTTAWNSKKVRETQVLCKYPRRHNISQNFGFRFFSIIACYI